MRRNMPIDRRELLIGGCLAAFATACPRIAGAAEPQPLRAMAGTAQLAPPEYAATPVWGYEGMVPGPLLRVPQGQRLVRRLVNQLDQPSTVHWHGIRIDNAMDGVPDLTQDAVPAGGFFDYDFVAPDAGTFWYHSHDRSWEQVARGLYGVLIVDEATPPDVDRDEVLVVDDWRLDADAGIHESFGALHDWSHAGRIGNWITVNGQGFYQLPVKRNERLRLRLVNTATARILDLTVTGMSAWIVAIDGQPLVDPVSAADSLQLAPAQRMDLIADILPDADEALLLSAERDAILSIAEFPISGSARSRPLSPPRPLPANPVPDPLASAPSTFATLLMEGGAMGNLQTAVLDGERTDIRDLADSGFVWAMNGIADMPEEPFLSVSIGETVRVKIVNDSSWPHGMHLHGHHFRRVDTPEPGPLRDTILLDARESAEIAFVADNPGSWLLHCHMLEHSVSGMKTWIRVA